IDAGELADVATLLRRVERDPADELDAAGGRAGADDLAAGAAGPEHRDAGCGSRHRIGALPLVATAAIIRRRRTMRSGAAAPLSAAAARRPRQSRPRRWSEA